MDSSPNSKSSWLLLLLLIVFSCFTVIQVGAVEADPEELKFAIQNWARWDILSDRSFGYGVVIPGRVITNFVPVNHVPPMNVTRVLTTCQDQQTSVSIKVFEGDCSVVERECAQYFEGFCDDLKNASTEKKSDCGFLDLYCEDLEFSYEYFGDVQLHAIPPALKGVPEIEVTFGFELHKLHVKVMDKATMKANSSSFRYGVSRSVHQHYHTPTPAELANWKVRKVDTVMLKATRNHIDSDAVCLM